MRTMMNVCDIVDYNIRMCLSRAFSLRKNLYQLWIMENYITISKAGTNKRFVKFKISQRVYWTNCNNSQADIYSFLFQVLMLNQLFNSIIYLLTTNLRNTDEKEENDRFIFLVIIFLLIPWSSFIETVIFIK